MASVSSTLASSFDASNACLRRCAAACRRANGGTPATSCRKHSNSSCKHLSRGESDSARGDFAAASALSKSSIKDSWRSTHCSTFNSTLATLRPVRDVSPSASRQARSASATWLSAAASESAAASKALRNSSNLATDWLYCARKSLMKRSNALRTLSVQGVGGIAVTLAPCTRLRFAPLQSGSPPPTSWVAEGNFDKGSKSSSSEQASMSELDREGSACNMETPFSAAACLFSRNSLNCRHSQSCTCTVTADKP
mmetsp:Transcript_67141/g.187900  ORF Transcript_67141/g.187900 Transcript_67141/m.187900 type:complete len:254 (-) Transcript_67141:1046-1807(-)